MQRAAFLIFITICDILYCIEGGGGRGGEGYLQLIVTDAAHLRVTNESVQLSVFSRSLTVISLRRCSRLKWMLRIQLRERE